MNIYLLNYNNKLNRKVKGYDNLASYNDYIIASQLGIDKSPKDSLNNTFIYEDESNELTGKGRPDYCIFTNDYDQIVSRWFIISCKHKGASRGADQYEIELERDIWYDFHETLKESTILCRRGYAPVDSPLILNLDSEEFPMNKIKYKEVLLKEEGVDNPYIYLYRTKATSEINFSINVDFGNMVESNVIEQIENLMKYDSYDTPLSFLTFGRNNTYLTTPNGDHQLEISTYEQLKQVVRAIGLSENRASDGKSYATDLLMTRNGKGVTLSNTWDNSSTFASLDWSLITDEALLDFYNTYKDQYTISLKYYNYNIALTSVSGNTTIESSNLVDYHTDNSIYDIYCLPYNEENLNIMNNIALDSASYELQILPYRIEKFNEELEDTAINYKIGVHTLTKKIHVCKTSKRKFRIFTPDEFNERETIGGVTELEPYNLVTTSYKKAKTGMNAYEVRLVSPDSQAIEVINPYFNYDGQGLHLINAFDVYIKLQPFSPYIQVKPVYKGYNGINVDDYRGLICGSGFSLAMANDQWATYQLNNKNYQQQFDREIQTQKINAGINMVGGIAKSVGQGAMGFAMGGVAGAVVGAGAGLVDTATQLGASIYNVDTAKKEFKWNIENIQNRARTLKNIDAQNPNFKFFPYLEVFKATDEEIERYSMFLMKHGSRINAEGQFKDFIDVDNGTYNYVEGTIDEYDGDDMDAMMLAKASDELNQGIYYEVSEDD